MQVILSFGVIPIQRQGGRVQVLMVQHRQGHWSFPKGHQEQGETGQETAIRELQEETGLYIGRWLSLPPLTEEYFVEGYPKKVTYFFAETSGQVSLQMTELTDYRWVVIEEASALATFPATQRMIEEAQTLLQHGF